MTIKEIDLYTNYKGLLENYSTDIRQLPGINTSEAFNSLLLQLIESSKLFYYYLHISNQSFSDEYADPASENFHPLKAAVYFRDKNDVDEASWLIFLAVHFGRKPKSGWFLVKAIYGRLNNGLRWNWKNTSSNPKEFRNWLGNNQLNIKPVGSNISFGNHRKYQSLSAFSTKGTGETIETYISWIKSHGGHKNLFFEASKLSMSNAFSAFDYLFNSMDCVRGFGRTGKYDYLSMIGLIRLADITPEHPYLKNSTGPMNGTKLLFLEDRTNQIDYKMLESWVIDLSNYTEIAIRIWEDALCNWQKNPTKFVKFKG